MFAICLAFLMLVGCASGVMSTKSAPIFVEASGEGVNRQAALNDAFKDAIQRSVGILLDSKATLVNSALVRDEINEYSSGYIESYEIVRDKRTDAGLVKVDISAVVSSTKLVSRFMASPSASSSVVDANEQIYAQVKTVIQSRSKGDRFLASLLSDYPRGSFEITLGKLASSVDSYRRVSIHVPYQITWSKTYLQALKETVQTVSKHRCWFFEDDNPRCRADIKFSTGTLGLDQFVSYEMEDLRQAALIRKYLDPRIGIQFSFYGDSGKYLLSLCEDVALDRHDFDSSRAGQAVFPLLTMKAGGGLNIFERIMKGEMERVLDDASFIANIRSIEAYAVRGC